MYSNTPVSTRCERTVREARSAVRSDTQLHCLPCSSGCMVSRKVTRSPCRDRISADLYSLNRFGQPATSLVMSHTRSIGAAMTIALSMCPAISGHLGEALVDVHDGRVRGQHLGHRLVRHRHPVLTLHPAGEF